MMIANTIKIRIPMNVLIDGMVIKREAIMRVDRSSYQIKSHVNVIDYSTSCQSPPDEKDMWALEAILEKMRQGSLGVNNAITSLVGDIINKEGDRVMMWPLQLRWSTSQQVSYGGRDVPDWLALDAYNAHVHGNPGMWNPYGRDQPADSINLSALDFIRTYGSRDLGLEWHSERGTLDTILAKEEMRRLSKLKDVSREVVWKWEKNRKVPASARGLQALSELGITLPLKGTDPMFLSLLALASRVFFHGALSSKHTPGFASMPWEKLSKDSQSLSAIDYRLWPFSAYTTSANSLTLNNPASAEIGRILTNMGVPLGSNQKYDGERHVLYPVSEAYTLLKDGAKDSLLERFIKEYVEAYFLARGSIQRTHGGDARLCVSFFGHRIQLPPDYIGRNGLDSLIKTKPQETGFEDHLRLIKMLLPEIRYTVQSSRQFFYRLGYYTNIPKIYILNPDYVMDAMPKLRIHLERSKMR